MIAMGFKLPSLQSWGFPDFFFEINPPPKKKREKIIEKRKCGWKFAVSKSPDSNHLGSVFHPSKNSREAFRKSFGKTSDLKLGLVQKLPFRSRLKCVPCLPSEGPRYLQEIPQKCIQDGWLENSRNLKWKNKKYISKDLSVLGALKNVSGEQTVNSPWLLGVFPWQPDWCQCWSSKLHDSTSVFCFPTLHSRHQNKKSKLQRGDKKWYIWDAPAIILATQIMSISFLDLRVPTLSNPHFQHWHLENPNSHIPKFV